MKTVFLILIASALVFGCAGKQSAATLLKAGSTAPEFSATDNAGQTQSLSSLREKGPVVLTFLRSFY